MKNMAPVEYYPQCQWVYTRGMKKGTQCPNSGNYEGRCCTHKGKLMKIIGNWEDQDIEEQHQSREPISPPEEPKTRKPLIPVRKVIPVKKLTDSEKEEDAAYKKKAKTELLKQDPIFNQQVAEEEPASNQKSSVWKFTVNSNTIYEDMTKGEKTRFKTFMDTVFTPVKIMEFLVDSECPEDPTEDLESIEVDSYFEVGSKGFLHAHGIIRMIHHGYYTLQLNNIRKYGELKLGKKIH